MKPTLHDIALAHGQGLSQFVADPYCTGQGDRLELSGPFDCLRDIAIGPTGRRARFAADSHHGCSGVIPALLLDSAWRLGAMYAVPGKDELYVPVRIGRVVIPVGRSATEPMTDWEIRASAPQIENGKVRWKRTEVLNELGGLRLVVEDAFAAPLQ